jgi:UDPglucose--hexose-1-phosphate uridylyltransferase
LPELRKDPVVGRWVIIATDRGKRPHDFAVSPEDPPQDNGPCPFCPGHEELTPPEVLAYRANGTRPNGPGWSVRVVPNKFPALVVEGGLNREGVGTYDKMSGVGAHEVIIETPSHQMPLADLDEKQVEDMLWAYRDRMVDLRKDTRFRYVMIFKNHGRAAGASLEHSHSQLIALPIVPRNVSDELDGCKQHYQYKERCIYCDIVRQELASQERVIYENADFVALSPFAPKAPFETWILPKLHDAHFEDCFKMEYAHLANMLRTTLRKINRALGRPPYNFILHTAPFTEEQYPYYHWHFEIMPALTKVAGFEWGSGFYINPMPPEIAAQFLREVDVR